MAKFTTVVDHHFLCPEPGCDWKVTATLEQIAEARTYARRHIAGHSRPLEVARTVSELGPARTAADHTGLADDQRAAFMLGWMARAERAR